MRVLVSRRIRQEKQRKRQNSAYQQGAKEWFKSVNEQGKNTEAKDDIGQEDIDRILKYWSEKWKDDEWDNRDSWRG